MAMRRVRLVAVAICLLGPTVVSVSPAGAIGSITVAPNTNLTNGQQVTVDGSGFPASVDVVVAGCARNTVPFFENCQGFQSEVTTSSTGSFSTQLSAFSQFGKTNCELQNCYVGAVVLSDLDNSATFAPIAFNPGLADGRIKRRSDGQIYGDNVYIPTVQQRTHTIAPGGYWTYALQVQNDGPNTDDITVRATNNGEPQFFYGYFDVTSQVTGPGLVFTAMAPGEVRTFALRFHVPVDAAEGTRVGDDVDFISNSSQSIDRLRLLVGVRTPTS